MSEANFAEALRRLLAHEGGYSNHPADPGGPTKYGITIADYRRYVKADASAADVQAMTVDEAKRIYRDRYWEALRCGELPSGVDYAVFDYGVNSGVARAGKVLRRVLGLNAGSTAVTAAVIAAVNQIPPHDIVTAICDERLAFLKSLKTWPTFGGGWGRRVADVRATALAMARPPQSHAPQKSGRRVLAATVAALVTAIGAVVQAPAESAAIWIAATIGLAIAAAGGWWLVRRRSIKASIKETPS